MTGKLNLNNIIKKNFKSILINYYQSLKNPPLKNEEDFIDKTVKCFKNINFSSSRQNLKSRSKKIHPTPQVKFTRNNQQTQVEMGDLFFICKHLTNNTLETYRALLVQVKFNKTRKRTWKIDTNQFHFLTCCPVFEIVKPKVNKLYNLKPRNLTWATYGLVGKTSINYPIYYSSKRILKVKKSIPSSGSFNYNLKKINGWDSSTSFLSKLIHGIVGENLITNNGIKILVDDLYKIAKWKPDPPDEIEWNNEIRAEDRGFGIVEFIVSTEEYYR